MVNTTKNEDTEAPLIILVKYGRNYEGQNRQKARSTLFWFFFKEHIRNRLGVYHLTHYFSLLEK